MSPETINARASIIAARSHIRDRMDSIDREILASQHDRAELHRIAKSGRRPDSVRDRARQELEVMQEDVVTQSTEKFHLSCALNLLEEAMTRIAEAEGAHTEEA